MLNNIVNSQEEDRVHIFPKTVEVDSYFSWNTVWVEKTDFEVYLYLQTPPKINIVQVNLLINMPFLSS